MAGGGEGLGVGLDWLLELLQQRRHLGGRLDLGRAREERLESDLLPGPVTLYWGKLRGRWTEVGGGGGGGSLVTSRH